jgi:hypothetical protein
MAETLKHLGAPGPAIICAETEPPTEQISLYLSVSATLPAITLCRELQKENCCKHLGRLGPLNTTGHKTSVCHLLILNYLKANCLDMILICRKCTFHFSKCKVSTGSVFSITSNSLINYNLLYKIVENYLEEKHQIH